MEDISNTANQENEYYLNVLFSDRAARSFTQETPSYVRVVSDVNDSDFIIDFSSSKFYFKRNNSLNFTFECEEKFIVNRLDFLYKNVNRSIIREKSNPEITKRISKIEKFHQKISDQNFQLHQLNKNLTENFDLIQFCQKLFALNSLKHFQTLHLFIHEKGQATSNHFEIGRESQREYVHNINEFTTLYQAIKKSKNRSFGQTSLKGIDFEILGTFLAHEFSLRNYNLILIISRNDFLPQTKVEQEFFNFLSKNLPSYIEILLESRLISSKMNITQMALDHSPYEITHTLASDSSKTFKLVPMFETIINKADVFHHERVSLLGELLNTLRHELSNPLFGLQLTTELLLLDNENEENKEFLNEILKSIKRSQTLIETFTNLYKGTEEFSKVDVVKVIKEVFTLTKSESRHLLKTVIPDSSSVYIDTNPTWLAQIFFNLIINSAQATKNLKSQSAKFLISIEESTFETVFHIQDNGPGIPEDLFLEIFKPFFTTKKKGTGLGLAISKSLANKLLGSLDYIPNDKGAYFLLKLPHENPRH